MSDQPTEPAAADIHEVLRLTFLAYMIPANRLFPGGEESAARSWADVCVERLRDHDLIAAPASAGVLRDTGDDRDDASEIESLRAENERLLAENDALRGFPDQPHVVNRAVDPQPPPHVHALRDATGKYEIVRCSKSGWWWQALGDRLSFGVPEDGWQWAELGESWTGKEGFAFPLKQIVGEYRPAENAGGGPDD